MVVVGAGRAGGSLARLWHQSGNVEIKAVYSRSDASELAEAVDASVHTNIENLPDANFLMVATPDASLNTVATQLAHQSGSIGTHKAIAFHLSGACSSDELHPLKTCGYKLASVHPLRSFASSSQPEFADTLCAIEGDNNALPALQQLFESIEGRIFKINKKVANADTTTINSYSTLKGKPLPFKGLTYMYAKITKANNNTKPDEKLITDDK